MHTKKKNFCVLGENWSVKTTWGFSWVAVLLCDFIFLFFLLTFYLLLFCPPKTAVHVIAKKNNEAENA